MQLLEISFGGQSAEELFFDDVSTGPAGDLAYATSLACQMVGANGMAGSLVSFAAVASGPLDGSNLVGRVLSDSDARVKVERLLDDAKARSKALLASNRHLVVALRDALLERHELVGTEITDILEAATAVPLVEREHDEFPVISLLAPTEVSGDDEVAMIVPAVLPSVDEADSEVIDLRDPAFDAWRR
jgi:hypothetical protein